MIMNDLDQFCALDVRNLSTLLTENTMPVVHPFDSVISGQEEMIVRWCLVVICENVLITT